MSILFKKKALSLAVLSVISGGISAASFADDNANEKSNSKTEETVVTGMRGSLNTSAEIKRNADTVKDVVTASDIGALPDKSVTEALQRIPGVAIERFESSDDPNHFSSEGSGVVVRGLRRIKSEINGRSAFSASSNGGGLSYADIPGELLGRVEVVKNTTADLVSGGVAGTVNLVTRKPFDSREMLIYANIKGSYGDLREELTPNTTFVFSNSWDSDLGRLGFLLGVTDSEYKDRGHGIGVGSYYERSTTAAETEHFGDSGTAIPGREEETLYTPTGVSIRTADSDRNRTGYVSSFQWANPSDTAELTAEYIYSDATKGWDERLVDYLEQGYLVNPNNIGFVEGEFDDQGYMTNGEVNTNWLLAASRSTFTETKIEDYSLNLILRPSEKFTVELDYQHVDSENSQRDWTYSTQMMPTLGSWYTRDGVDTRPSTPINNTGVAFDLRTDVPSSINFTGDPANPVYNEQALLRSKMDHEAINTANLDSASVDVEYEIVDSWITSVKGGVYGSRKEQLSRNSDWNWGEVGGPWSNNLETSYLKHPDLFDKFTFEANNFFGGGKLEGDQTFLFPSMEGVRNFNEFGDSISDISAGAPDLADRPNTTNGYLDSEITETQEERVEAYVQVNYEFLDLDLPIKGNMGLRYISWQVESEGGVLFPEPFGWDPQGTAAIIEEHYPEEFAFANGAEGERTTVKGDRYTKILPSFNLSMELKEDTILRFAASKNVFFPKFRDFQNYQRISTSRVYDYTVPPDEVAVTSITFSGKTGNPNIKPEEALNLDVSFEYYFTETGSATVSIFHKDFENIIRERLYTENVVNPEPYNGGENIQSVDYQTTSNDSSGSISGIEISYVQFYSFLPGPLSGLGMSFNYTYISQSDLEDELSYGEGTPGEGSRNNYRSFEGLDLPGYSSDVVNITLMYENDSISSRLAYNWRSDYLLTRRDADLFAPVYANATGQLDGSISYRANENLKFSFQVSNILDEVITTDLMYNQEGVRTPRSFFKTDRRFGFGVTYKF